jgi:hypothetical protein
MQITSNTTGMEAGIAVATDKDGRDHAVVVVKATMVPNDGGAGWKLALKQEPLVYADAHFGDPAKTSIKYECDFARIKPRADVIVIGHAYAPHGEPVGQLDVTLEVDDVVSKSVCVYGNRKWEGGLMGFRASEPVGFVKMPLVYEKAFGGSDHTHDDPKRQGSELRNLVGIGFHKNSDPKAIDGSPLPNLEHPSNRIKKWSDTPPPVSLGIVGRGWQPRIGFAGSYDEKWMAERLPFLPQDFEDRYFNSAADDQQVASLKGGETVRCTNMTASGSFSFVVPAVDLPVVYQFRDRQQPVQPMLDTLILEPDKPRVLLVWRASVPLGRKMNALRGVLVGVQRRPRAAASAKRRFDSLGEMIAWEKENK